MPRIEKEFTVNPDRMNMRKNEKDNWKVKMQTRINDLRADISKVNQITALHQSPKMKKNANAMKTSITKDEEKRKRNEKQVQNQD